MKFNLILTLISLGLAGFATYSVFVGNSGDYYRILITVGAGISFFVTLCGMLAIKTVYWGTSMNIRVISGLFFLALLIDHIVFSFIGVKYPHYIIITGVLMLLYILTCYLTIKALKEKGDAEQS